MLGRTISDPHGVENENSLCEPLYPAHCEAISHEPDTIAVERIKRDGALPLRGMELIDTDTTLMPEKMRTQTRGKFENVTGIFPHFPDWNFPAMRFIWERQRFPPGNIRRHWYSWQMAEPTGYSAWKKAAKHPAYTAVMCTAFLTMETLPCAWYRHWPTKKGVMETGGWR